MLTGRIAAAQRRPRFDEEAGETDPTLSIPSATQLPAPTKWAACAKSAACCICAPFKSLILWVVGVLVAVAVITILIILLINQTDQGSAMIQTFMARIHFNSMVGVSAMTVIPSSTHTLQAWIEIRRDYVRVSVTIMGITDWSTLVLAQRQANQSISLYTLLEHTPGTSAVATVVLTCPVPWGRCHSLLEARLAGDHLSLLLLAHPLAVTIAGLPPPEDVLLQVSATAA
jgi:hypothetical protein